MCWLTCAYDNNRWPDEWREGIIIPIFKAGEVKETKNYREITLLNTGYKMVTAMMAARLSEWLEKEKKLTENQAGFRRGYSSRDNIFTLNTLIENRKKKRWKTLYLKTAFDRVNRRLLMEKLWSLGVTSRMLRKIEEIYRETRNVVAKSSPHSSFPRVRQDCPLSPSLFAVFINDIERNWETRKIGGTELGKDKVFCLKFADDIAVIAEAREDLQDMIPDLERYIRKNKLEVNISKSQIVVFRNGGRLSKRDTSKFGEKDLLVVNQYKYLGYIFTATNSPTEHLTSES
uniref:Reverse transcriptase domain-containing protein n=1 Tax=Strigamia maritima TaxID=126957 RepID=T1IQ87_STRMM